MVGWVELVMADKWGGRTNDDAATGSGYPA